MIIREKLKIDETVDPRIGKYKKIFLSGVIGVILVAGENNSVLFKLISGDDGNWFPINFNEASSYWLSVYEGVLRTAREWCEKNCIPNMHNGIQYGWRFK